MPDIYELARSLLSKSGPTRAVNTPQPPKSDYLGTGLAAGAENAMQMYPVWQQQTIDGQTDLPFEQWLQEQGIRNPIMPSATTTGVRW